MDLVKAMLTSGQYTLNQICTLLDSNNSSLQGIANYIVDNYENGNYSEILECKSILLGSEVDAVESKLKADKKRLEVEKQVISTDKQFKY